MPLVDPLAEALAADRGGRPDDGRTGWHVVTIILRPERWTRLFVTRRTCENE
jgi:hypothetical protein